MKKEVLLTISVVVLLLLNISTLGFMAFYKPAHPPMGPGPALGKKIVSELAFDESQKAAFEILKSEHQQAIQEVEAKNRAALTAYFDLLKSDTIVTAQADSLEMELKDFQQRRTRITLQHFMEVKQLCNAPQKQKFNAMIPELLGFILQPQRLEPKHEK